MEKKLEILTKRMPKAMLKALTKEAEDAVPATLIRDGLVVINRFPFRIGRESRVAEVGGKLQRIERPKKDDSEPNNDLYLIDAGHLLNISREHLQIEKREDGYYLVDRGSACGTKLEDRNVGGQDTGGSVVLKDGDRIGIGAKGTPYVYEFISFDEFELVPKGE